MTEMTSTKDGDINFSNKEADKTYGFIMDKAMQYGKEIDQDLHTEPYAYEIKQAQIDFKEDCEYEKKKHSENEVKRLCDKVLGIVPLYEMTFEEYWRARKARGKARNEILHHRLYSQKTLHKQPIGMSKKQWIEAKKKIRRQQKEDNAKQRADEAVLKNTPTRLFEKKVNDMWLVCECNADEMRQGVYCDICKIVLKIDEYTMTLLRREAEEV